MIRVALILLALCLAPTARADKLVTDLSERELSITAGFAGDSLVLFGTTDRPDGDLIIRVKGPGGTEIIRRKDPLMGLWINRGRMVFQDVPGYYDISASAPLHSLMSVPDLQEHRFGLDSLSFRAARTPDAQEQRRFNEALIQFKQVNGLFALNTHPITRISPRLFRTRIWLPANVPIGNYQVTTHLVVEGQIMAEDTQGFSVRQAGLSGFITTFAHDHAFFYGLFAVFLAVFAGWISNEMFRRE